MRQMTLDEKISIKGQLARKDVLPRMLVTLTSPEAARLYWACYGRPVALHSTPKKWRQQSFATVFLH